MIASLHEEISHARKSGMLKTVCCHDSMHDSDVEFHIHGMEGHLEQSPFYQLGKTHSTPGIIFLGRKKCFADSSCVASA